MSLNYKGRVLHDAGCSCCSPMYADANTGRLDPTGTGKLRSAMSSAMAIKLNMLRPLLRAQLVTNDILGLNMKSAMSSIMVAAQVAGGANKVEMFQRLFDTFLANTFLDNGGDYVKGYMSAAYEKGLKFARTNIDGTPDVGVPIHLENDRMQTLQKFVYVELQGVAEALSQQAVRAVADGLLSKQPVTKILKNVLDLIRSIGLRRSSTVAEFMIVKAFNEAALDLYASVGIKQVGIIPEFKQAPAITEDALRIRRAKPSKGPGSRVSRERTPSARTIARIRAAEEKLSKLKFVNVRTAGDDRVCPICEDIEEEGPYTIDMARSLIPAHPRCRCVFIPARVRVQRSDSDDGDPGRYEDDPGRYA